MKSENVLVNNYFLFFFHLSFSLYLTGWYHSFYYCWRIRWLRRLLFFSSLQIKTHFETRTERAHCGSVLLPSVVVNKNKIAMGKEKTTWKIGFHSHAEEKLEDNHERPNYYYILHSGLGFVCCPPSTYLIFFFEFFLCETGFELVQVLFTKLTIRSLAQELFWSKIAMETCTTGHGHPCHLFPFISFAFFEFLWVFSPEIRRTKRPKSEQHWQRINSVELISRNRQKNNSSSSSFFIFCCTVVFFSSSTSWEGRKNQDSPKKVTAELKATSPTRHQRRRQLPLILVPFSTQFSVFGFCCLARRNFLKLLFLSLALDSCLIFISRLGFSVEEGEKVQVRDI